MPQFNDAQLDAIIAREADILVSAGAGSGKTAVLTERYFRLLDDIIDGHRLLPEDILTITFTRKAAQEMRTRIAQKFETEGRHHERRQLSRAPISTMHGFCESILRDHALAAGIDPNFRVLDEAESRTLQDNTLDQLFADIWSGTSHDRQEIARLLLGYQQGPLRKSLLEIYSTLASRGVNAGALITPTMPDLAPIATRVNSTFAEMEGCDGTANWQLFRDKAMARFQKVAPLFASHECFNWDTYQSINDFIASLTLRGGYKPEVRQILNNCKEAASKWLAMYLDLESPAFRIAFTTLLNHFIHSYQAAKNRQGLLDFADLLIITRELLTNPEIKPQYLLQRFRHILVDEFQDTNDLQFSIISALRQRASLFMVGDVKQAIYRFIGSDIRVFLQAEKNIVALPDNSKRIPMQINYRSRPEIIEPLNAIFTQLWPLSERNNGFYFEELSAGAKFTPRTEPSIELAFFNKDKISAAEHREAEAAWIARRILQLTGTYDAAQTLKLNEDNSSGETSRPAEFADFMLLFRVSTDIPLYENALRDAGIPYYTVSGRGFYGTREVQDILYMLRVLENPHDDFALAVVLRSPLAGVSDDALYWLTRDWSKWQEPAEYPHGRARLNEGGNIWQQLQQSSAIPAFNDRDKQALKNLHDLIVELLPQVASNQPLDLIDTILTRTDFASTLPAMEHGEQRHANIKKLREVAATFQNRGIFGLADFQRYLTKLNDQAAREATAPLETEGSNVVRLMTIHAAKGLQAPIVILADCGREQNKNNDLFIYDNKNITCKLFTPDDEIATPESLNQMQQNIQQEEREETDRLLYVALTRAEDYLICSGFTDHPPPDKWKNYADILSGLTQMCGNTNNAGNLEITYRGVSYQLRINSPEELAAAAILPVPTALPTLWEKYQCELCAGAELPVLTAQQDVDYYTALYDRLMPIPPTEGEGFMRIGVHRALCFRNCPRQYWFRYLLGGEKMVLDKNEEEAPQLLDEAEKRERLDNTETGSLLHKLMQSLNFQQPLLEQFATIAEHWRSSEALILSPLQKELLQKFLYDFTQLPLAQQLSQARACHPELSFLAREGKVLVPGIIDLLVEMDDGWWIIDYKTGQKSADHLRQLAIYARGAGKQLRIKITRLLLVYFDENHGASLREEKCTDYLLNEAQDIIHQVAAGVRKEQFSPTPGHYCRYCPAVSVCPEGKAEG